MLAVCSIIGVYTCSRTKLLQDWRITYLVYPSLVCFASTQILQWICTLFWSDAQASQPKGLKWEGIFSGSLFAAVGPYDHVWFNSAASPDSHFWTVACTTSAPAAVQLRRAKIVRSLMQFRDVSGEVSEKLTSPRKGHSANISNQSMYTKCKLIGYRLSCIIMMCHDVSLCLWLLMSVGCLSVCDAISQKWRSLRASVPVQRDCLHDTLSHRYNSRMLWKDRLVKAKVTVCKVI